MYSDFERAGYSPDEIIVLQEICAKTGIEPNTIICFLKASTKE